MADARDIVTASMRELGVFAAGEDLPGSDALLGLDSLNRLLDQWASEKLQIFTTTRTTFTITTGVGGYTVGTGGTVNVARPVFPEHVGYIDTSTSPTTEILLQPFTEDGWASVAQKGLTGSVPSGWYYNPTFPLGRIDYWPVPTSTTLQGVLYAPQAIARLTSLSTAISMPPGYERMLVKNLAVDLAPSYKVQLDPMLVRQAMETKAGVKAANSRVMDLSFDTPFGHGGGWDIRVGP